MHLFQKRQISSKRFHSRQKENTHKKLAEESKINWWSTANISKKTFSSICAETGRFCINQHEMQQNRCIYIHIRKLWASKSAIQIVEQE
jgi:hypothetical protein